MFYMGLGIVYREPKKVFHEIRNSMKGITNVLHGIRKSIQGITHVLHGISSTQKITNV